MGGSNDPDEAEGLCSYLTGYSNGSSKASLGRKGPSWYCVVGAMRGAIVVGGRGDRRLLGRMAWRYENISTVEVPTESVSEALRAPKSVEVSYEAKIIWPHMMSTWSTRHITVRLQQATC